MMLLNVATMINCNSTKKKGLVFNDKQDINN